MEQPHHDHARPKHREQPGSGHYSRLYVMAAMSFVAMFFLMYAMVDRPDNVYANFNQAYMAALMAAPMVLIELWLMSGMYPDKRKNLVVGAVSVVVAVSCWILIRQQAGIGNAQFLRSMIPHHAGAILMCEELRAHDADIRRLCDAIIASQRTEITEMRAMLAKQE